MSCLHSFSRAALTVCCGLVCAGLAHADARDGLRHWWKATDLNGDGVLQPGEVYDVMTQGAATPLTATEILQNTTSPDAQPIRFNTEGVTFPTMRRADDLTAESFTLFNPTNYSTDGKPLINLQSITLPNAASVGGESATVMVRFKWRGLRYYTSYLSGTSPDWSTYSRIYCNDYSHSGNQGWAVGLAFYDRSTTYAVPALCIGNSRQRFYNSSWTVYPDAWYDYAVTFSRNAENQVTARCYFRRYTDTGSSTVQIRQEKCSHSFTSAAAFRPAGSGPASIGYNGSDGFARNTNNEESFGGMIHEIKVWDRALSYAEVLGAFTDREPAFTVGSANGSADEFSDAAPAAVFDPATMPWSQMRRSLTAEHPSVTIRTAVPANSHTLGRVLRLGVVAGEGCTRSGIKVDLNGARLGHKVARPGEELLFWISPERMAALEQDEGTGDYPMTITISRTGRPIAGTLLLDHVAMGGAWQLGVRNDSADEFGQSTYHNYHYFIAQNNPKQLASNIGNNASSSLYGKLYINFELGDWEAKNLAHRLTVRGRGSNPDAIELYLNGAAEPYQTFAAGFFYSQVIATDPKIEFPAGTLQSGMNELYFTKANGAVNTSWNNFDFWRLETVWTGESNYNTGMSISFR